MSNRNLFYYKKSLGALEYFKVLEKAASRCVTEEAANRLRELLPLFDAPCAQVQIDQTAAAMHLLESIQVRTAEWYYLAGEASLGLGNRIAAMNYARQAVRMEPNSFEYRALLSRLEGNAQYYQTNGNAWGFGMPSVICSNPILSCWLANALCQCCCGGRFIFC